jgi:hypothetical protein
LAIVWTMRPLAFLSIVWILTASGARAGETRCWFENGAVVISAAFGDMAGDFILDLSAPRSQLHDTKAQSDGIEGGSARRDLILAGETLRDVEMPIVDLDARAAGLVTSLNGIIGADVLAPFVVELRFSPCRVTLHRRPWRHGLGGAKLTVREIGGAPAVEAAVSDGLESRRGWFAIDTASMGSRIADAVLSRSPPKDVDPASRALPIPRLRALSLAGRLFEQSPADLLKDAPEGLDGTIGDEIWSRYQIVLDIQGGWLRLTPAP